MSSDDKLYYNNLPINNSSTNFIEIPDYKNISSKEGATNKLYKQMIGVNSEKVSEQQLNSIQGNTVSFKQNKSNLFKPVYTSFDKVYSNPTKNEDLSNDDSNMIMPYSGNSFGSAI